MQPLPDFIEETIVYESMPTLPGFKLMLLYKNIYISMIDQNIGKYLW